MRLSLRAYDMRRSRRRGPSGNETGIGTLQEDRETLEEVASGRGGKGCRTCGRLFSDEPEMKEGVTVPTAKCFDDEGDKQNAISLTGPRVFIYLGSFHRLEGGAGGDGRPRNSVANLRISRGARLGSDRIQIGSRFSAKELD